MVLVSVLAIFVIMQTRHDHRTTRAAAGRCCEGVAKHDSILCQCIDVWRDRHRVAVAAKGRTFIIGDEKHNVSFGDFRGTACFDVRNRSGNDESQANDKRRVLNLVNHSYPVKIGT